MKVRCVVVFVSLLLSSNLVAIADLDGIKIAQQPASTQQNISPDEQKAYARAKQLNEEALKLQNQGTAESRQQALAKYEEALKLWRQLGMNKPLLQGVRSFEATTLLSIGTLYLTQSEPQKALSYFNQGLFIRRELKDRLGEAIMLSSLGNAYSNLSEKQKALSFYNQALSIFQAENKSSLVAQMLSSIGGVYFSLGQTQKAIASYFQALEIQRRDQDTTAQAQTLQALGRIYAQYGETQKALAFYNQALEIQRTRKDLVEQAEILSTIGFIYSQLLGDNQKALMFLNDALTLQHAAEGTLSGIALAFNLSREAQILGSIAGTYKLLGNYPKTLEFYNKARSLLQKAGNRFAEAEQILALLPPQERQQMFDFEASRITAISSQLQQYRIVHFATHGILNSKHPELSGVVLSLVDETGKPKNGFLRLQDIFNLNLPAELVVLSACETGLGEEVKGEGIIGLTRGFMYAGSPRVVVSLWSVDDEGTAELMKKFYTKLLRQGLQPAAALRAAQIEMWRNQNFAAPYYWAAFTLQGEWKMYSSNE